MEISKTGKRILAGILAFTVAFALISPSLPAAANEGHDHSYDADTGFCTVCGAYQPASYNGDGDVYEISNAGQLFWFAALVNGTTTIEVNESEVTLEGISEADTEANGKLTANIDITGYTWTPIGNYDMDESEGSKYYGDFDGWNYTVLGLRTDNSAMGCPQGLFGYIGATYDYSGQGITVTASGTVQNVTVEGTVTGPYAGGVAGYNDGTVSGCTSHVTVSGSTYVGGVVGVNNGTVTGCSNTDTITGTGSGSTVGGAVGKNSGKMSDCTNSGSVSGSYWVGGVVGNNDSGTVSGCTNSGTVTGTSTTGNASVGGIIGYNYGGTISGSTNDAGVSGGQYTGGVVGYQYYGTVSSCTNSGDVTGSSGDYVGGVVGLNYTSKVSGSANLGDVTGGTYAGGVVGRNYYDVGSGTSTSIVTGSYNVGAVTGTSAGLVAGYNSGEISGCFYLGDDTSTDIASDDGGIVGSINYAGAAEFASGKVAWLLNGESSEDEDIIWYQNLDNGETEDAYPVTDGTHGTVYSGTNCAGNTVYSNTRLSDAGHLYDDYGFCRYCGAYEPAELTEGIYQIENAGNLYWFAALVMGNTSQENITAKVNSVNAALLCDIDLSVTTDTHTDTTWTPIGDYSTSQYSGTFDGGGYTISGLYINNTSGYYQGLFGYISGGTVKNVTVEGSVTGAYCVGGVAGYVTGGGTVTGCINHADVTATGNRAGGVVGYSAGMISNCANTGAICGSDVNGYAGGIAGSLDTTDGGASNCYNVGTVSGDGSYMGGIAGYLGEDAAIDNCYYLDTVAVTAIGAEKGSTTYTEARSSAEFASGEVAWLLQKGQASQITLVWGQDLTAQTADTDDDQYPVLNRMNDEYTLRVVKISFYYLVDNAADSAPFAYGYTNYATTLAGYPSETGAAYTYYTHNGETYTKLSTSMSFGDDENVYVEATYTVSQMLSSNVTSDNDTDSASRGSSYSATLTVSDGYIMSVTVTMGGEDITDIACPDGSTVNIESVTGAVTVTAATTAKDYAISYDANGGTGTMADSTFSGSGSVSVAENGFTYTGYTFNGWNTAADGSGKDYETGDTIDVSDFSDETSLALYAQWTADTDSGTTDPGTTDPGTTDPDTTDPGTTDPDTTDPGTTDPSATDPGTTGTETTNPSATDPGTTDSGTTDSGAADSGTTDTDTQIYDDGHYYYRVTSYTDMTAEVIGLKDTSKKNIVIYDRVLLHGQRFTVTAVAEGAFQGNRNITSVTLKKNIVTIGAKAFAGCTLLKKVTIKSKVLKSIGRHAFKGDKKLTRITLKTTKLKTVGKKALSGISAKCVIKVPKSKKAAYTKLFKGKGQKKTVKVK